MLVLMLYVYCIIKNNNKNNDVNHVCSLNTNGGYVTQQSQQWVK